jgi:hypothetical protein
LSGIPSCGVEDMAAETPGWRRGASLEAAKAVRHFPQGFTRDDGRGEDECGLGGTAFGDSRRLDRALLNKAKSVISVIYATITVGEARTGTKASAGTGWGSGCAYLAGSSSEPLGDKGRTGVRRDHPLLLAMRFENVFF